MKRFGWWYLLLASGVATAHIKLMAPTNINVTDVNGSPNKAEPCGGAGTPTNVVTTVDAGSLITVMWTEPIFHPGHFRISLADNASTFVTPTPVLTNGGTRCSTAPIESFPSLPTLVDGYAAGHTREPDGGYTLQVLLPDVACENCVLQVMQFMSAHAPPCFYYQCANLKIVKASADAGQVTVDAGQLIADGGPVLSDAGTASDAGQLIADGGMTATIPVGCGCTAGSSSALLLVLAVLVVVWSGRRQAGSVLRRAEGR